MIFVVDNYDSFTYNLVQYLGQLGEECIVRRNDSVSVSEVMETSPDGIVISPGPGSPASAGICLDLIRTCAGAIPIFGVCLGHQCIVEAFGGRIIQAKTICHGKASEVFHDGLGVFRGIGSPLKAGRYHSLAADPKAMPPDLEITAQTADGEVMGVRHRSLPVEGVQFHPESILTEHGMDIVRNFLRICSEHRSVPGNPTSMAAVAR